MSDFFTRLGLSPDASAEQVVDAYLECPSRTQCGGGDGSECIACIGEALSVFERRGRAASAPRIAVLAAENARLNGRVTAACELIGFLICTVRSGKGWTDTCEAELARWVRGRHE